MAAKNCTEPGCPYPKKARHPKWCIWHWLNQQPVDDQVVVARARKKLALEAATGIERVRVPDTEWPTGERWCSGCQSFVPLWYTRQARCIACQSSAQHAAHIRATYGIDGETYERLYEWQGGRCYICQRKSTRRLAVDHDHVTGRVRGLLCSDDQRGCNHAILGNIKNLDMARRIVDYLEHPPLVRLRGGEPGIGSTAASRSQTRREAYQRSLAAMFPHGPLAAALMEKDAAEIRAQLEVPAHAPSPQAPVSAPPSPPAVSTPGSYIHSPF